jgi:site-specific recombinase XerC
VRDKSYQLLPLGQDAAAYLRNKRKRLTDSSYRDYEGGLDKLARHFPDLQLEDFEPPVGTERLEEFLDAQWGAGAPRTYNKNLSILGDFFKFQVRARQPPRRPDTPDRARPRPRRLPHHVQPGPDPRDRRQPDDLRDRLAVRLLLDFGLRKGALKGIQFKHFDHYQRRLTIFTKGEKVRMLPIPSPRSGTTSSG